MINVHKYQVRLLNDDTTTLSQAAQIISHVFNLPPEEGEALAHKISADGEAVAGEYMYEVAETKVSDVNRLAELNNLEFQAVLGDDTDEDDLTDDGLRELNRQIQDKDTPAEDE